jgi:WD40 repeat protein
VESLLGSIAPTTDSLLGSLLVYLPCLLLKTGDNYGRLQLFRYPAHSARLVSKRYKPSSNVITATCFVQGGAYAVSISGSDNCILKWRFVADAPDEPWSEEERVDDEIKAFCIPRVQPIPIEDNDGEAKMWLMTLVEPTDTAVVDSEVNLQPPSVLTELTHVFGLCTESMRSMVRYNLDGGIIYPASKYACVYSKRTNAQIFYKEHQNPISCLTVSSDGKIVASVEECARPSIRLWDACTTRTVKVLPVLHRQGLSSMQFSSDSTLLLSVGKDRDRSIALWESLSGEWTEARLKAWSKGSVNPVMFASFYQHNTVAFVSGGEGHIKFWQVSGRCMNPFNAEYNAKERKIGNVLCGSISPTSL